MNKEALRKELEDCWDARDSWTELGENAERNTYIASVLSGLEKLPIAEERAKELYPAGYRYHLHEVRAAYVLGRSEAITIRLAALDDGDDRVGNWVKASDRLPGIGTYYVKRISTGEKMISRVTKGGMQLSVIYREPDNILWLEDNYA